MNYSRISILARALVVVALFFASASNVAAWDTQWGYDDSSSWDTSWGYDDSSSWDTSWGYDDSSSWDTAWGYDDSSSWDTSWGYDDSSSWDTSWGYDDSSSWDTAWGYDDSSSWDTAWGYDDSSSWDTSWGYDDSSSWDTSWGYDDSWSTEWGYDDSSSWDTNWGYDDSWDTQWGYDEGDQLAWDTNWGYDDSWDTQWGYDDSWDTGWGYDDCSDCGWDNGWYDTAPIIYQGYDNCGSDCGGYYDDCGGSNCNGYYGGNGGNGGNSYSNSGSNVNQETVVIVDRGNNNNDDDDLSVVCRASDTSIEEGDRVTYSVEIDGGNSPFDIDWSGDVDGSGRSVTVRYNDAGRYEARVTVTDDEGNRASDDCADVIVDDEDNDDDDDDFSVLCRVSDTSVEEGDRVTFEVEIDGGDRPFEIRWSGDLENKSRYDDEDEIRVTFDDNGRYEVRVTVEDDDGNEDSDNCALVRVSDEDNDDNGATLISNPPSGTPASASSVYLSQVPYTGAEDVLAFVALSLLAVVAAGYAVFRKAKNASVVSRKEAIDRVKAANLASRIA